MVTYPQDEFQGNNNPNDYGTNSTAIGNNNSETLRRVISPGSETGAENVDNSEINRGDAIAMGQLLRNGVGTVDVREDESRAPDSTTMTTTLTTMSTTTSATTTTIGGSELTDERESMANLLGSAANQIAVTSPSSPRSGQGGSNLTSPEGRSLGAVSPASGCGSTSQGNPTSPGGGFQEKSIASTSSNVSASGHRRDSHSTPSKKVICINCSFVREIDYKSNAFEITDEFIN
jgi:hypothetical protein